MQNASSLLLNREKVAGNRARNASLDSENSCDFVCGAVHGSFARLMHSQIAGLSKRALEGRLRTLPAETNERQGAAALSRQLNLGPSCVEKKPSQSADHKKKCSSPVATIFSNPRDLSKSLQMTGICFCFRDHNIVPCQRKK